MTGPAYKTAEGLDRCGTLIWQTRLIEETSGAYWLGTGREHLFYISVDLPQALSYYIGAYPGTSRIRVAGPAAFADVDLSEAAHRLLIDSIMEKIRHAPS